MANFCPIWQMYWLLCTSYFELDFRVQHFHSFLFGHHFELATDHQPLLALFHKHHPTSAQASAYIKRWSLLLSAYEYKIPFEKLKLIQMLMHSVDFPCLKFNQNQRHHQKWCCCWIIWMTLLSPLNTSESGLWGTHSIYQKFCSMYSKDSQQILMVTSLTQRTETTRKNCLFIKVVCCGSSFHLKDKPLSCSNYTTQRSSWYDKYKSTGQDVCLVASSWQRHRDVECMSSLLIATISSSYSSTPTMEVSI